MMATGERMAAEPFRLTMFSPAPDRRPYQLSTDDGATWRGLSAADCARLSELAPYPDDARARIDQGETVRIPHAGYLRRRPTAAQLADQTRQLALA